MKSKEIRVRPLGSDKVEFVLPFGAGRYAVKEVREVHTKDFVFHPDGSVTEEVFTTVELRAE
jgi:hypothetical protein